MNRILKSSLAFLLAFVMIFGSAPLSGFWGIKLPGLGQINASAAAYITGDHIYFGSYPQTKVTSSSLISSLNSCTLYADNTVNYGGLKYKKVYFTQYTPSYYGDPATADCSLQDENGYLTNTVYWFKYEPIQWRVLSNSNGELFVMAEKILETKAYNQAYTNVTWETCSMRTWLNNDFYNTAFSLTEKAQINTSTVVNADNPWYGGGAGGRTTNDKLFLLSYADTINTAYGFSSSYSTNDTARRAQGTDFSKSSGLYVNFYSGNSHWWLRSPGDCQLNAGFVSSGGVCNSFFSNDVTSNVIGLRPALRLKLSGIANETYENFNNYNPNVFNQTLATRCAAYTVYLDKGPETLKSQLENEMKDDTNKLGSATYFNFNADVTEYNCGVLLKKKYVRYNNQKRLLTIVVIAGTQGVQWQSDMDVTGLSYNSSSAVHSSFLKAEIDIKNKLKSYLSSYDNSLLLITGHSRGGAVANLLADDLTDDRLGGGVSDVFAYTFAAPNTTKEPHNRPNIFNLCFSDDFVTNFPLNAWGYYKHGQTISISAQVLYNQNAGFKNEMNAYVAKDGRFWPDFDMVSTTALLTYVNLRWSNGNSTDKNAELYYIKHPISFLNGIPYPDNTLYDVLRDVIAPAAMKKPDIGQLAVKAASTTYAPIVSFFVSGYLLRKNVADTHMQYTYYAATKYINVNTKASSNQNTQAQINEETTPPVNPNQDEIQKLKTFAQHEDNLMKLGWDLNNYTTWQGVKWDNESENRITEIDIRFLDLSGTLDLADFTSLTSLNCSGNGLTDISLTGCAALQNLNCAYNLLPTLSIGCLPQLSILDCSYNKIEELDLGSCAGLTNLICSYNLLQSLDIKYNIALTDLNCSGNFLTTLDFSYNTQLLNLNCEDNYLDIQSGSAFQAALNQLSQNDGSWVKYEVQKMPEAPVFDSNDISLLTTFANHNNNLERLGWDLSKPQAWSGIEWSKTNNTYCATRIDFSNLSLSGDLDFSGMANLTYLNMSGNQLPNINVTSCPELVYLNCNNSEVQDLNISNCPKLLTFSCQQNYLNVSPGSSLTADINLIALKENFEVNYLNQYILADKSTFNQTEYSKLIEFANTGDNPQVLGWDLDKPGEWEGITWAWVNGEYRVKGISVESELITGAIDLSGFSNLHDVNFNSTKITSITLPNCLTEIQDDAFGNCGELSSIILPVGIVRIGGKAFFNCTKLGNVTIPASVKEIGDYAFAGCASFTDIFIPKTIEALGEGVFSNCLNIEDISVDGDNLYYSSDNRVLFNKDKSILILCTPLKSGIYNIPEGVVRIESGAFSTCNGLSSISVPTSVTDIDALAFSDCTNLSKLSIPNILTNMKLFAVTGCNNLEIYCSVDSFAESFAITNAIRYILYPDIRKLVGSNTVFDRQKYYIYGLSGTMNTVDGVIQTVGGAAFEAVPSNGSVFGTGSTVKVMFDGSVVKTYKIIIFGDVNGDGNIDAVDADTCVNVQNWMTNWDHDTQGYLYKAGDVNGDGNVDAIDADIMTEVANYRMNIDQTTGLAHMR